MAKAKASETTEPVAGGIEGPPEDWVEPDEALMGDDGTDEAMGI